MSVIPTHEVHEVSITQEVQERETLLGRADLDVVKKGVSNVTEKRGRGPYRKYTDQDRAHIGKNCSIHGAAATVCKFVQTFRNLNESAARTIRQKYEKELKQAEKEQCEPKQLQTKNGESLSSLAIWMEWFKIILE